MKNSHIEWTTHTFNPWEGCTKVSPGCAHCYAETRNARFGGGTAPNWGKGAPRRRTSAENWKQPVRWNREARAAEAAHWPPSVPYERPRVFCASLADWLDEEVSVEWLADLLDLIRQTPHLDWLLLSKRPSAFAARLVAVMDACVGRMELEEWIYAWMGQEKTKAMNYVAPRPPANVWIGTTVEDQQRADERIPFLLRIPARVRFLSCEPLLGPVEIMPHLLSDYDKAAHDDQLITPLGGFNHAKINWVICGGESGAGARPMHPDWARGLRDQCEEWGTHFFFKQWGEHTAETVMGTEPDLRLLAPNQSVAWGDGKTNHTRYTRVGKLAAGRLLDGREWSEIPKGAAV